MTRGYLCSINKRESLLSSHKTKKFKKYTPNKIYILKKKHIWFPGTSRSKENVILKLKRTRLRSIKRYKLPKTVKLLFGSSKRIWELTKCRLSKIWTVLSTTKWLCPKILLKLSKIRGRKRADANKWSNCRHTISSKSRRN